MCLQFDSDEENGAEEGAGPQPPRVVRDGGTDALEDDVDLEDPDDDVADEGEDGDDEEGAGADAENVSDNRRDGVGAGAAAAKRSGPSMRSDYRGWVKARKPAWRAHRAALKAQGPTAGGDGAPAALAALGGGMQKQVEAIMHATWNIIQVRAAPGRPGASAVSSCGCAWMPPTSQTLLSTSRLPHSDTITGCGSWQSVAVLMSVSYAHVFVTINPICKAVRPRL